MCFLLLPQAILAQDNEILLLPIWDLPVGSNRIIFNAGKNSSTDYLSELSFDEDDDPIAELIIDKRKNVTYSLGFERKVHKKYWVGLEAIYAEDTNKATIDEATIFSGSNYGVNTVTISGRYLFSLKKQPIDGAILTSYKLGVGRDDNTNIFSLGSEINIVHFPIVVGISAYQDFWNGEVFSGNLGVDLQLSVNRNFLLTAGLRNYGENPIDFNESQKNMSWGFGFSGPGKYQHSFSVSTNLEDKNEYGLHYSLSYSI